MKPSVPQTPPTTTPPAPKGHDAAPRAAAPREMSKDERRIIFAKVDEFYVGSTAGFAPGWSDNRVAQDLGVPRAWVSTVRDEFFGPEHGSAEMRSLLEKAEKLEQEVAVMVPIVARVHEDLKRLAAIEERLPELQREIGAIVTKVRETLGIDK